MFDAKKSIVSYIYREIDIMNFFQLLIIVFLSGFLLACSDPTADETPSAGDALSVPVSGKARAPIVSYFNKRPDKPESKSEVEGPLLVERPDSQDISVVEAPAAEVPVVAEAPVEEEEPVEETPVAEVPVEEEEPVVETPVVEAPVTATTTPVVIAKPVMETPVATTTPVVIEKPVEEAPVTATTTPVVIEKPVEEAPVTATTTPVVIEKPVMETPVATTTPVVIEKPVMETPVATTTPVVIEKPVMETPVATTTPVVIEKPVEEAPVTATTTPVVIEKPVMETPVATTTPVVLAKPVMETPVATTTPVVIAKPVEEAPVTATTTPVVIAKPVMETPVATTTPVVIAKPVEEAPVTATTTPVVIEKPVMETPVAEVPVEEEEPVVETPVVEAPVVAEKPVEETPLEEEKVYTITHAAMAGEVFRLEHEDREVVLDKPGACVKVKESEFAELTIQEDEFISMEICDNMDWIIGDWDNPCSPGNYNLTLVDTWSLGVELYDRHGLQPAQYNNNSKCLSLYPTTVDELFGGDFESAFTVTSTTTPPVVSFNVEEKEAERLAAEEKAIEESTRKLLAEERRRGLENSGTTKRRTERMKQQLQHEREITERRKAEAEEEMHEQAEKATAVAQTLMEEAKQVEKATSTSTATVQALMEEAKEVQRVAKLKEKYKDEDWFTITHAGREGQSFTLRHYFGIASNEEVVLDKPGACAIIKKEHFKRMDIEEDEFFSRDLCDRMAPITFIDFDDYCEPGNYELVLDDTWSLGPLEWRDEYAFRLSERNDSPDCEYLYPPWGPSPEERRTAQHESRYYPIMEEFERNKEELEKEWREQQKQLGKNT